MKKAMLSLATCLIATLPLSAQRKGLWITPNAHIGGGSMVNTYPAFYDTKFAVVFGIGADASYMFTDHLGAGTGFSYSGYGYFWRETDGFDDIDHIGAQGMLDIPVFFKIVAGKTNGFFANVGFINGIFLGSQQTLEVNGTEIAKVTGSESNEDFNKFSLSPFAYFGGNIRCGRKVQLTVGPQFSYQLNSNFSSESGRDGHYLTVALKVGVGIHAWRPHARGKK